MSKVITREFDNSTVNVLPTVNFSVVVPGYLGTDATDAEHRAKVDPTNQGVYELSSQEDFIKYIGHHSGKATIEAAPKLCKVTIDENGKITTADISNSTTFTDYIIDTEAISKDDIDTYLNRLCTFEKVKTTEADCGKNGKLLITTGSDTYRLTKTTSVALNDNNKNAVQLVMLADVIGAEGTDKVEAEHIGNQIAYELLGLGYKVFYKPISTTVDVVTQLASAQFWAVFKDRSIFNYRYLMTGGCYDADVMNTISSIATFDDTNATLATVATLDDTNGRGDVIALCDIDETGIAGTEYIGTIVEKLGKAINKIDVNKNAAIFGPRVNYTMSDAAVKNFGGNKQFPASFNYLACAALAQQRYAEWYAVAGYTRGISKYTISSTTLPLGEIAINTLAPRATNNYVQHAAANLVLSERGNYYLWGNRTAAQLATTDLRYEHFLNIRQLCITIKQVVYTACRQFTFDPDSDLLWINFTNAIKPTLDRMTSDQGIRGYKITKVESKDKAVVYAKIRIIPIEAVEDFDISISLEESISGTTTTTANDSESE